MHCGKKVDVTITQTHTHTHACWRIAQRESHRPVRLYMNHVARPHRASKGLCPFPSLACRISATENKNGGCPGNHRRTDYPQFLVHCDQSCPCGSTVARVGPELAGGVCARGCRASLSAGSAALLTLPRWLRIALRTNGGRSTHT
jgi:hypothetical protein